MTNEVRKVVILAAGKSTRTYPLTVRKPKPMLKVANKTLMAHNLKEFAKLGIKQAIIVVHFEKEQIIRAFGDEFHGLQIDYVEQPEPKGTGHAVLQAKPFVSEKFLLINGDDMMFAEAMAPCLKHELCVLGCRHPDPTRFGVIRMEGERVVGIEEKPQKVEPGSVVSTGAYVLQPQVFDWLTELKPGRGGEILFTDLAPKLIEHGLLCKVADEGNWVPLTYAWDVLIANERLLRDMTDGRIEGEVDETAQISGPVVIEEGAKVYADAVIEGPAIVGKRAVIGAHAIVRRSVVGDRTIIADEARIESSVIYDSVTIGGETHVWHSVVGDGADIGEDTEFLDEVPNKITVRSVVKGVLVNSGLPRLGAIIGDGAHIGDRCTLHPGVKVWPDQWIENDREIFEDVTPPQGGWA